MRSPGYRQRLTVAGMSDNSVRSDPAVLDNPVWAALNGPQRALAEIEGKAGRYSEGISPFHGVAEAADPQSYLDLAELIGPGVSCGLVWSGAPAEGPLDWETVTRIPGVQMVDTDLRPEPDPEAVVLGKADVPEMLDLVGRTRPGPFLPRTIELGTYLGIRRDGVLIAMAGERIHPPGWTEISAVCTDVAFRGQGLGARLVLAVAAGIRERGEMPFLHAAASNTNAIRLYEAIGFAQRRQVEFLFVRSPIISSGMVDNRRQLS